VIIIIRTMLRGTTNVAHKIIKLFRFILAISLPIDLLSNFRKEPKVNIKIATER